MPVTKCSNGKWKIGSGKCMYTSREKAMKAYTAYLAKKQGGGFVNKIKDYAREAMNSRQGAMVNKDGSKSTHLMAWGESDGNYVAYPTLFQKDDGEWYQPMDPFKEAKKKGELYKFDNKEEARDFADGFWKMYVQEMETTPLDDAPNPSVLPMFQLGGTNTLTDTPTPVPVLTGGIQPPPRDNTSVTLPFDEWGHDRLLNNIVDIDISHQIDAIKDYYSSDTFLKEAQRVYGKEEGKKHQKHALSLLETVPVALNDSLAEDNLGFFKPKYDQKTGKISGTISLNPFPNESMADNTLAHEFSHARSILWNDKDFNTLASTIGKLKGSANPEVVKSIYGPDTNMGYVMSPEENAARISELKRYMTRAGVKDLSDRKEVKDFIYKNFDDTPELWKNYIWASFRGDDGKIDFDSFFDAWDSWVSAPSENKNVNTAQLGGFQTKGYAETVDRPMSASQNPILAQMSPVPPHPSSPGRRDPFSLPEEFFPTYESLREPTMLDKYADWYGGDNFEKQLKNITKEINVDPRVLKNMILFESTGDSGKKTTQGTATGLIQFLEATSDDLGVAHETLNQLTPAQQLTYVGEYLKGIKKDFGLKDEDLSDPVNMYLSVFYPSAIKKGDDYVIGSDEKNPEERIAKIAEQNPTFSNGKDKLTKGDIRKHIEKTFKNIEENESNYTFSPITNKDIAYLVDSGYSLKDLREISHGKGSPIAHLSKLAKAEREGNKKRVSSLSGSFKKQKGGKAEQILGYSDGSPYANKSSITIEGDTIDMSNTGIPLLLEGDNGVRMMAKPYGGTYKIPGAKKIKETPLNNNTKEMRDDVTKYPLGGILGSLVGGLLNGGGHSAVGGSPVATGGPIGALAGALGGMGGIPGGLGILGGVLGIGGGGGGGLGSILGLGSQGNQFNVQPQPDPNLVNFLKYQGSTGPGSLFNQLQTQGSTGPGTAPGPTTFNSNPDVNNLVNMFKQYSQADRDKTGQLNLDPRRDIDRFTVNPTRGFAFEMGGPIMVTSPMGLEKISQLSPEYINPSESAMMENLFNFATGGVALSPGGTNVDTINQTPSNLPGGSGGSLAVSIARLMQGNNNLVNRPQRDTVFGNQLIGRNIPFFEGGGLVVDDSDDIRSILNEYTTYAKGGAVPDDMIQIPIQYEEGGEVTMAYVPKAGLGKFFKKIGKGIKKVGKGIWEGLKGSADFALSNLGMPSIIDNSIVDNSKFLSGFSNILGKVAPVVANAFLPGAGTGLRALQGLNIGGGNGGQQQPQSFGGFGGGIDSFGLFGGNPFAQFANHPTMAPSGYQGYTQQRFGFNQGGFISPMTISENIDQKVSGTNSKYGFIADELKGLPSYGEGMYQVPMFQQGGEVQPGIPKLIPIQTEKGEKIIHFDGSITDVNAKKKHRHMDDDLVTDIVPEGTFIASADKEVSITLDEAEDIVLGVKTQPYDEAKKGMLPEVITLSDLWTSYMSKKVTPAELAQRVKNKYKVVDRDDLDIFDYVTNSINLESRLPFLQAIMTTNEAKRQDIEIQQFKKGGKVGNKRKMSLAVDVMNRNRQSILGKYQGGNGVVDPNNGGPLSGFPPIQPLPGVTTPLPLPGLSPDNTLSPSGIIPPLPGIDPQVTGGRDFSDLSLLPSNGISPLDGIIRNGGLSELLPGLFGGGAGGGGQQQQIDTRVDPLSRAAMLGSVPVSVGGQLAQLFANQGAGDRALANLQTLGSNLSDNINRGVTAAGGSALAKAFATETDLPELRLNDNFLRNIPTRTPRSFIDAAATPIVDTASIIQQLGNNGAAAGALANINSQSIRARNQRADQAWQDDRNLMTQIAQLRQNIGNQENTVNQGIREREVGLRNQNVRGLADELNNAYQSGLSNQSQLANQLFQTGTNLDMYRSNLEGQGAQIVGNGLLQFGNINNTLRQQEIQGALQQQYLNQAVQGGGGSGGGLLGQLGGQALSVLGPQLLEGLIG